MLTGNENVFCVGPHYTIHQEAENLWEDKVTLMCKLSFILLKTIGRNIVLNNTPNTLLTFPKNKVLGVQTCFFCCLRVTDFHSNAIFTTVW